MGFTVNWATKVVISDASISDFPVTRGLLRALEETEQGVANKSIFNFEKLSLGSGAWMYDITFINGYTLQFPSSGAYSISGGNFNVTINDTGVQVNITRAAAYAVTSVGGSGFPTAEQTAAAVGARTISASLTADQSQRVTNAILFGKVSGAGTGVETFRDPEDTKDVCTITADASGNRTLVVLDAS